MRCTTPTRASRSLTHRTIRSWLRWVLRTVPTTRTSLGSWTELELIGAAVEKDVPVLGLCFGGEVLSAVLGGRVERAPVPELGWREIETDDPDAIPAGPWLEWHYERFTTPPGAVEVARTADAVQAFRLGPHLGSSSTRRAPSRSSQIGRARIPRIWRARYRRRQRSSCHLARAGGGGQGGRLPPLRRVSGGGRNARI